MAGKKKRSPRAVSRAQLKSAEAQAKGLIAAEAAEGKFDSKGTFTVDRSQARRKLGAHQLPDDGSWLLALVQAANQGRASSVVVGIQASRTVVTLRGWEAWRWAELESTLDDVPNGRPELRSLARVLRFLATRAARGIPYHLRTPSGERVTSPVGDSVSFSVESTWLTGVLGGGETVLEVSHSSKLASWQARHASDREIRTALYEKLVSACLASPVPVTCDGRKITGRFLSGEALNRTCHQPVGILPVEAPEVEGLRFPMPSRQSFTGRIAVVGLSGSPAIPKVLEQPLAALGVLSVAVRQTEPALGSFSELEPGVARCRMLWVLDGVVVRERVGPIEGCLGLTLLASAQGLNTDLSGLKLSKDRAFGQRRNALSNRLLYALGELKNRAGEEGFEVSRVSGLIPTVLAVAIILVSVTNPISSMLAIPAGLATFRHGHYNFQRVAHWDFVLDTDLAALPARAQRAMRGLA